MQIRSPLIINMLIISLSIALGVWGLKHWQRIINNQFEKSQVLVATERLTDSVEALLKKLTTCQTKSCSEKEIEQLQEALDIFINIAAQEKQSISVVGATEYLSIKTSIFKHKKETNDKKLFDELALIYIELRRTLAEISYFEQNKKINEFESSFYNANMISIAVMASLMMTSLFYQARIKHISKQYKMEGKLVDELVDNITNVNEELIIKKINDISISKSERKIYSRVLDIHKSSEIIKNESDLHKQLYTLIGFEMRGISTTISGGINVLFQDSDEDSLLMAKNITSATETLTELANNYNQLINQGVSNSKASFLSLLSNLSMHIKSKLNGKDVGFECYIEDNIPNYIDSNQTKLFWVLFLQTSSSLLEVSAKTIVMHIYTKASEKIESTTIYIDLFFVDLDLDFSDLLSKKLTACDNQNKSYNEWSRRLLESSSSFDSYSLSSDSIELKRIKFDATPINFFKSNAELQDYNILICGDSALQVGIINKILTQFHCKVSIATTPNDVFKKLPVANEFNAIILTDTTKGIQLKSFCRTLKSRLNKSTQTKLFLAISELSIFKDINEHVDKVFYTPLLPHEFIPNLIEALNSEESIEQIDNNILIVEDDKIQQLLLAKILKKQEFESNVASTGEAAIEYFKQNDVDIIFMDCIMPGMGGLEATKAIRELEKINNKEKGVTIIGATALTSESEHKACIDAGMDLVISKPYKNDEISKSIKKYSAIHKTA